MRTLLLLAKNGLEFGGGDTLLSLPLLALPPNGAPSSICGSVQAAVISAALSLVHLAVPDPEFVGYTAGPQMFRDDRAREGS